jgi:ribosomal protein S12 methylthiotransferase
MFSFAFQKLKAFMRTKKIGKNKVNVITLGCSKNMVDSEILMHQLKVNDFDVIHDSEETLILLLSIPAVL